MPTEPRAARPAARETWVRAIAKDHICTPRLGRQLPPNGKGHSHKKKNQDRKLEDPWQSLGGRLLKSILTSSHPHPPTPTPSTGINTNCVYMQRKGSTCVPRSIRGTWTAEDSCSRRSAPKISKPCHHSGDPTTPPCVSLATPNPPKATTTICAREKSLVVFLALILQSL